MTLDVLSIGEAMGVVESERIGPLRLGGAMRMTVAGAESTVCIGVSRLGGAARWIGVVGDDEVGALVRRTLAAEGVETDGISVDPERPTGLMLKERRTSAATRVRYYRRHGAGGSLGPEHVVDQDMVRAAWLHLSGITPALSPSAREAVRHASELASSATTRFCFDVNFRSALWSPEEAVPVLTELAKRADLLLATREEAALLTGATTDDPAEAASALASLGPQMVVVKLGAAGAVAWENGAVHRVSALTTTLVDPVGAGDSFAAGLLADLARGASLESALGTAAAVAAIDVSCPGDWEGLPTRTELEQLRGVDVLR